MSQEASKPTQEPPAKDEKKDDKTPPPALSPDEKERRRREDAAAKKLEAQKKREADAEKAEERRRQNAVDAAVQRVDGILQNAAAGNFISDRPQLSSIPKIKEVLVSMQGKSADEMFELTPGLYRAFKNAADGVALTIKNNQGGGEKKQDARAMAGKIGAELQAVQNSLMAVPGLENYSDEKFIPKTPKQASAQAFFMVDGVMNQFSNFVQPRGGVRNHLAGIKSAAREMADEEGKAKPEAVKAFYEKIDRAVGAFEDSMRNDATLGSEKKRFSDISEALKRIKNKVSAVKEMKISLIELPDDLKNPAWAKMANEDPQNPLFSDILARIGQTAVTPEGDPQVQTAGSLPRKTNPGRVA